MNAGAVPPGEILDTHGFTAFLEDLARLSGKDFEHVCMDQTAAILRICMRRTRAAKVSTIVKKVSAKNNHVVFEDGQAVSVWKKADHAEMFLDTSNWRDPGPNSRAQAIPPRLINGKSWHEMNGSRRWSNQRWGRYQFYLAEAKRRRVDLAAAKASRGVSKASWLQIAEEAGLDLGDAVPAYVRSARPSNGKVYRNGFAKKTLEAAAFVIEISNDHPIVVGKLNGAQILQGAIDTRMKAFGHEMRTGVFDDIAARAKRYPGLFTA